MATLKSIFLSCSTEYMHLASLNQNKIFNTKVSQYIYTLYIMYILSDVVWIQCTVFNQAQPYRIQFPIQVLVRPDWQPFKCMSITSSLSTDRVNRSWTISRYPQNDFQLPYQSFCCHSITFHNVNVPWNVMTHMYYIKWAIIDSSNGLSTAHYQVITWNNSDLLSITQTCRLHWNVDQNIIFLPQNAI